MTYPHPITGRKCSLPLRQGVYTGPDSAFDPGRGCLGLVGAREQEPFVQQLLPGPRTLAVACVCPRARRAGGSGTGGEVCAELQPKGKCEFNRLHVAMSEGGRTGALYLQGEGWGPFQPATPSLWHQAWEMACRPMHPRPGLVRQVGQAWRGQVEEGHNQRQSGRLEESGSVQLRGWKQVSLSSPGSPPRNHQVTAAPGPSGPVMGNLG
ncbi:unnamed protein product [Caretta caretta]